MNDVDVRTRIIEELYVRRMASADDVGAVEVAALACAVGENATRVAVICSDLASHRHVDGDGNLTGFVRISDGGVAYYEEVVHLNESRPSDG